MSARVSLRLCAEFAPRACLSLACLVLACAGEPAAQKAGPPAAASAAPGVAQATSATPPSQVQAPEPTPTNIADSAGPADEPELADEVVALPDPFVAQVLAALRPRWDAVLDDPARYRFEFIVTEVGRPPKAKAKTEAKTGTQAEPERISLTRHSYREDAEYIYPASAIKTFAALAAMRKLASLERANNKRVGLDTPLALCSGTSTQCRTHKDESNLEGGAITLGHEIRKMLLVSNNTAFNRLMQFVGYDEFHADMRVMGFDRTFVRHPLWVARSDADPTYTATVHMRPARGKTVVIEGRAASSALPPTQLPRLEVGSAYLDDAAAKARVDAPMDFSAKNFVSLDDFHRLTLAIVLAGDPRVPDLGLSKNKLRFLRRAMTQDPLASENPVYTDERKSALRYKPMLEGVVRVRPQARIEYVNKAGRAFGFHVENAYVRDRSSGRAFVVTVAIYVNDNGVLNDDLYQYDAVSRPLLKDMGEVLARLVFDPAPSPSQ